MDRKNCYGTNVILITLQQIQIKMLKTQNAFHSFTPSFFTVVSLHILQGKDESWSVGAPQQ